MCVFFFPWLMQTQIFLYKPSNTWQRIFTPTRIPRVYIQICHTTIDSTFASFRKLYLDSLAKTTEKHHVFGFRQSHDQQMAFWHNRDSGWRSRTKLHQKHLFRDSEHTYNRWFLTCFREHGVPSTWRWKFHELNTNFSLGLLKSSGVWKESE